MAPNLGTSGAQGTTYEARMCMLFFVRGYIRGLKDFKLEYQVNDADKFDDLVFDDGTGSYQIIQLKHKENENQWKITNSNLFTEKFNTDFNLIKYVKAVLNANLTQRFKDKINDAIVVTNIDFDLKNEELSLMVNQRPAAKVWYDGVTSIKLKPISPDASAVFNTSSLVTDAKYYKFNDDPNIVQILKRQAITLVRDVGTLTEDEIREALDKLIYAVRQPNVTKLTELIKEEMKDHFKLNDADSIYSILEKQFRDWCDTKNPLELLSTSTQSNVPKQYVLSFTDADKIFQKLVKKVSFDVTAPTAAFTGRIQELDKIRQQLNQQSSLIVSHSVTISGLGGIGKTQLVKQFIKQFGQSDFYGRIVWIESENDETVKNSFERLAQSLNIQELYHKSIKGIICEVFQYFEGFKVLFVFDNFDKSLEYEGNLVTHCCKTVSDSTKNGKPYFLFTSRNRECLPGVPLLDLNVLSAEDAVQLIRKELTEANFTETDAEKLVKDLHYFPLALRQAIAYIKQQRERKQLFGKRYEIQDYFKKFDKETKELLDFKFPGDFGENEKTTFVTWNVTLDAIKVDKVHGKNAIQVLKMFAYLYPDKISAKMFLPLFDNDEEKTADAILLLEKYSMVTKLQQDQSTFYQIHRLVQAVVQLKFQNYSAAIQQHVFKLINPKMCELYENLNKKNEKEKHDAGDYYNVKFMLLFDMIDECSADQILHYNTLSVHMLKHDQLKIKYKTFFTELNSRVLWKAAAQDDVEKVKALEIPADDLKKFLETNIDQLMYGKCNKVLKYFVEAGLLEVNDRIDKNSLIKWSVEKVNVEIFQFLIEHGADFSEVLESASLDLVSEIKNGESKLLQNVINDLEGTSTSLSSTDASIPNLYLSFSNDASKSDSQKMLNECLFFAIIFNQVSVVKLLSQNIVNPNYLYYKTWSLIEVAFRLENKNLLEVILSRYDHEHLKKCLRYLVENDYFSYKEAFEIIYKGYLKLGGDLVDDYEIWDEVCSNFYGIDELDLAHFFLNGCADFSFVNVSTSKALTWFLWKYEEYARFDYKSIYKCRVDKLINRIIFHNFIPDKFINVLVDSLFEMDDWSTNEYYRNLFEKMVRNIGDINVRNAKGETLLIKYLQVGWMKAKPNIKTVKYLVEQGAHVEAQDHEGKSAPYFAVKIKDFEIFKYLLVRVTSVDEKFLEETIKNYNKESVQKLLGNYFPADFCFENGTTLIQAPIENVSPNIVLLLKDEFKIYHELGRDVNKQDIHGKTLLTKFIDDDLWSARYPGDIDDVKFFVENGVNVDIRDNDGKTALFYAALSDFKDIFLYLLKNSKSVDQEALFVAITHNKLSKVEDLPQEFNVNHILKIKTRLLDYANYWKASFPTNNIIDFLNELELKHKITIN